MARRKTRRCSTVKHHAKKRTSHKRKHAKKHGSKGKKHLHVKVEIHHKY